jgi:radical SAM superfamily enzyme YgiQ (UPF0313 family)
MPAHDDFFQRSAHLLRDWRLYIHNPGFGNPAWGDSTFRILVLRLSPWADVQRSTPHLFLFREARRAIPDAFIDMAFLPRPSDAEILAGAGLPLVIGTQSHRPLGDFDLVLVSNSWLLEQVNLPFLLSRCGAPLWAGARGEEWPPVILGGSNATAAHALVSGTGDCMADAIFFGEGEGSVEKIVRLYARGAVPSKRARLSGIAEEVSGLWVAGSPPASVKRARASASADGPSVDSPAARGQRAAAPVLPGPESATARLSITRGCPSLCSFCFEAHDRKPFREIPAEEILRRARELKISTGASTLEVESFNFNTHSGLVVLLDGLNRLYHRVNLMSQRVDILARTPGLLDLEIAGDKLSFTLGIEGISERLRRFLHKSLEEEDIRRVIEGIHERKSREMKLFYMLTGRETEADLVEFAAFVRWVKLVRQKHGAGPRVVFSFGYLVRMPFTPLRHDPPVLREDSWREIGGRVKSACETNGFEFRLSLDWADYAATQALALGGTGLHVLLEKMSEAGCITDTGLGEQARQSLTQWLGENRAALEAEKPRDADFPFSFLDDENSRRFLHAQYERAKQGLDDGYPGGSLGSAAGSPGPSRPGLAREARALGELMRTKHRLKPVYVTAHLPRDAAGMGSPWVDAWLLRTLLAGHPDEADNILSVTGTVGAGTAMGADDLPWFGQTVAAVIAWDPERLARSLTGSTGPFGGIVPGFDPEARKSLRVRVELPSRFFPDPAQRLADFLRDAHAPVTLSRAGNVETFTVPQKSLKKKMLLGGTCRASNGGTTFDLDIGSRPFLREWLESFRDTATARRALVEIL